jgi:hypothetical protein
LSSTHSSSGCVIQARTSCLPRNQLLETSDDKLLRLVMVLSLYIWRLGYSRSALLGNMNTSNNSINDDDAPEPRARDLNFDELEHAVNSSSNDSPGGKKRILVVAVVVIVVVIVLIPVIKNY